MSLTWQPVDGQRSPFHDTLVRQEQARLVLQTGKILGKSAQLAIAQAAARGAGLISLPLLTHWLTPSAYGQAALASTMISLASVIGLMGMDMSYARAYLSRTFPNGEAAERYSWRFAIPAAAFCAATAGAVWLLHSALDPLAMADLSALVLVGTALSILMAMAQTRARLQEKYSRIAVAVGLGGVGAAALTVFLAWAGMRDERALVFGYVTAYAIPVILLGLPGRQQLFSPSGLDRETRRSILMVGLPGVITAPAYWILASSDRWFLQAFFDSASVGVFAVACTFGQLGMMFNSAIASVWLPEATRLYESKEADSSQRLATGIHSLSVAMAIVALGVGLFGGELLVLMVAEKFRSSAELVPWLALAIFFYGTYHLLNTSLYLTRQMKWSALAWLIAVASSLAASWVFVPLYGMVASALTQLASFMLLCVMTVIFTKVKEGLPVSIARLSAIATVLVASMVLAQAIPVGTDIRVLGWKGALFVSAALLLVLVGDAGGVFRSKLRVWRVKKCQQRLSG